jgi:hypothetical protein
LAPFGGAASALEFSASADARKAPRTIGFSFMAGPFSLSLSLSLCRFLMSLTFTCDAAQPKRGGVAGVEDLPPEVVLK